MTTHPQLDSAAAVVWCEYFHPGRAWKPSKGSAPMAYATVERDLSGTQMVGVTITDFNEIHRAAAVLVGRGFAPVMSRHMIREEWPVTAGGDFVNWLLTAPADAWARAILATVREVSKA